MEVLEYEHPVVFAVKNRAFLYGSRQKYIKDRRSDWNQKPDY